VNDAELIEKLTHITAKQSEIIYQLYGIVKRLGATTSIDNEVTATLQGADTLRNTTGIDTTPIL